MTVCPTAAQHDREEHLTLRETAGSGVGGGFFFSSRRRHTRLQGDWSSDVCSSDLAARWDSRTVWCGSRWGSRTWRDRKSTRLNSSHLVISYAVFCLKKKNATLPILCKTSMPCPHEPDKLTQRVLLLLQFYACHNPG